jgi:hypothetical protein
MIICYLLQISNILSPSQIDVVRAVKVYEV